MRQITEINFKSKRHQEYLRNWNIFMNDPDFKRTRNKYIAVPLAKEMVELYRDLSFKDNIRAEVANNEPADSAVDRMIYENEFDSMLSEMAITVAAKGGAVFKNYLNNGKSEITYVQPDYYFPQIDPYNQRKLLSETIAFPVTEGDEQFLFKETYAKRDDGYYWCTMSKSYYADDGSGAEIESEEVNTFLTESPLTYVPFSRRNGEFFGYSMFTGMENLLEEYNWRVSQISKILDKHSNPSIIGSETLLDAQYQFSKSEDSSLFLPTDKDEVKPEYMSFESKLQANFDYIENVLMKSIYLVSPFNPSLYGLSKEASAASARSIKIKSFRTQNTIENSLLYWKRAIKKVLFIAQQLEVIGGNENYTPALPKIDIYVSMPKDKFEEAQEEQLKVSAGITAIKSSIGRMNPHYTSQQVEEEYLMILQEQAESTNSSFLNDSMFSTSNNEDVEEGEEGETE
ncbi:phage portal protein [Jeotgalibacillus malaysiensis]|uniref:phage portal protein n=1 Tax=Jeotgalibacillus malaysiensis TaxID=1508404 RepID=UPI00384B016A